jgi:glycine betaine/proline transport system permease protein
MSLASPDEARSSDGFGAGQRWNALLATGKTARWDATVLVLGPLWFGAHRLWLMFWPTLVAETLVLTLLVREGATGGTTGQVVVLLTAFAILRVVQAACAAPLLCRAYERWRHADGSDARPTPSRIASTLGATAVFLVVSILAYGPAPVAALRQFPAPKGLKPAAMKAIASAKDWMVDSFAGFFNAITFGVRTTLNALDLVFVGTPWPIMALLLLAAMWRVSGRGAALVGAAGLLYLGAFGYWDKAMSTIALVSASTLICVVIGLPIGILCAKRPRLYAVVRPVLDFMQTMPSFVYLIPAVAFFSIGKPPGVLATVVFALPVMIRLTALGIEQVPEYIREGARAFGASRWQLLAKVELPLALPSIAAAVNQTIMMCLSMVIITAMIGAGGLGLDIMTALRQLNIGEGVLAGTAIVVCALVMDRLVQVKKR